MPRTKGWVEGSSKGHNRKNKTEGTQQVAGGNCSNEHMRDGTLYEQCRQYSSKWSEAVEPGGGLLEQKVKLVKMSNDGAWMGT